MALPSRRLRSEISREELYNQAWKEPIATLAKKYGISGAGLRKICIKHDIPVPGRGYWAKVKAGERPKRDKLPKRTRDVSISIRASEPSSVARPKSEELLQRIAQESLPNNKIHVKDQLRGLHPIASHVLKTLRASRPNQHGLRECTGDSLVHVRVAPDNIKRATLIVDALIRAAVKRGCEVQRSGALDSSHRRRSQTSLLVEGEPVRFYLSEKLRRVEHEPTPEELDRANRWSWSSYRKYDHIPTGIFHLEMRPSGGSQRTWKDTKSARLEERLNDVIVGLFQHAEKRRIESAVRAEEERLRRIEQQRLDAIRLEREREAARLKQLWVDADAWAQAERLRAYIAAVEDRVAQSGAGVDYEQVREWLAWARARTSELDPLMQGLETRFSAQPPDG